MGNNDKIAVYLTENEDGTITKREITQDELGILYFNEGDHEWDQVHLALPDPVWERIYDGGRLKYEGYTLNHKPFGAGRTYSGGTVALEGIFGIKGLLFGRVYYPNGKIRFEGMFRLNQAYGYNFPEYGTWYSQEGKRLYRGEFGVSRTSLGWPRVYKPEGFGSVPVTTPGKGITFLWDDAWELMKRKASGAEQENGQRQEPGETAAKPSDGKETDRRPEVYRKIDLLKQIRLNPDMFLPIVDHAWKVFPKEDRGKDGKDYPVINMGWDVGLIDGNRPYFLECWAQGGITMLTYFISAQGIGNASKEDLLNMLTGAGLFRFRDPASPRGAVMKFEDGSGKVFYSINITVGIEDETYIDGGKIYPYAQLNEYNSGNSGVQEK